MTTYRDKQGRTIQIQSHVSGGFCAWINYKTCRTLWRTWHFRETFEPTADHAQRCLDNLTAKRGLVKEAISV